jgi:SAM-dependent methyltransferase
MTDWFNGIPYEIAFWKGIYRNKKERENLFSFSNYLSDIRLTNFDVAAFLETKENPIVVDVGCGLSFAPGETLHGKRLDMHYVDPLATFYNRITRKYKLDLPEVEFGLIEFLSGFFPQRNLSLIIVQNALDHSADPVKGIVECLDCLETGGVLYLKHHRNEAETENYRGFHQFNVVVEEGRLFIWNKEHRYDINALLEGVASVGTSTDGSEQIAVVRKIHDLPDELRNDKEDIRCLANRLLFLVECVHKPSFVLKYYLRSCFFTVAQFFVQFLSYDAKGRLKRLLRFYYG